MKKYGTPQRLLNGRKRMKCFFYDVQNFNIFFFEFIIKHINLTIIHMHHTIERIYKIPTTLYNHGTNFLYRHMHNARHFHFAYMKFNLIVTYSNSQRPTCMVGKDHISNLPTIPYNNNNKNNNIHARRHDVFNQNPDPKCRISRAHYRYAIWVISNIKRDTLTDESFRKSRLLFEKFESV